MMRIAFTILGEPASKANSRKVAQFGDRPAMLIKSDKARGYEADALKQIPPAARLQLKGPVRVTMRIFYASERPDLDETLILDILQDRYQREKLGKTQRDLGVKPQRLLVQRGVYVNDRQVREKHVYHAIDKLNPRTEIVVEPMEPQQVELPVRAKQAAASTRSADLFDPLEV
jgi:Holliday junction resolvase RusA-like endonuclease